MSQHPRHPESEEPVQKGSSKRQAMVLIGLVVFLVLAMVVLHITGVLGPRLHGG